MNTQKFNQIVSEAKAKAANDPKWLRAIEKAAAAILSGEMIVTTLVHGALVTTAGGTYTANGACDCPARTKHCYHRAGARLMAIYEETAPAAVSEIKVTSCDFEPFKVTSCDFDSTFAADVAASPRKNLIIEIQNTWPKTWPPLYCELLARFGKSDLNDLDDDMLRRVRLAIAA